MTYVGIVFYIIVAVLGKVLYYTRWKQVAYNVTGTIILTVVPLALVTLVTGVFLFLVLRFGVIE